MKQKNNLIIQCIFVAQFFNILKQCYYFWNTENITDSL